MQNRMTETEARTKGARLRIRPKQIRYRCPTGERPMVGELLFGAGSRARYAYRVLAAAQVKGEPGLGTWQWRLTVESMPIARGRQEAADGTPYWHIEWSRRRRKTA